MQAAQGGVGEFDAEFFSAENGGEGDVAIAVEAPDQTPSRHAQSWRPATRVRTIPQPAQAQAQDVAGHSAEETERLAYIVQDDARQLARMRSQLGERIVLSSLLRGGNPSLEYQITSLLAASEFGEPLHRNVYSQWLSLHQRGLPCDFASLIQATGVDKRARDNPDVYGGGEQFLVELATREDMRVDDDVVQSAVMRIKDLAVKRAVRSVARDLIDRLDSDSITPEDTCVIMEDAAHDIRTRMKDSRNEPQQIGVYAQEILQQSYAVLRGESPPLGTSCGLRDLDRLINGGFKDENFIVLGARPGMGKTALAINFLLQCAYDGAPGLKFSLEMRGAAIAKRALTRLTGLSADVLQSASSLEQFIDQISSQARALSQLPLYIDDSPGLSMGDIRARSRVFAKQYGTPGLIVVDYLQFIAGPQEGNGPGDRQRAIVSDASRSLKRLARELRCPVLALAQLNRDVEQRLDKRPHLSDLKESGQIEQDADLIMFAYRDEYYRPDTEEPGITELIVAKQREGKTGTVKLAHHLAASLYRDL